MKKKLFLIKKVILFSTIIFYLAPQIGIVLAQEAISPRLSVSPHTFELDVFPGEVREERIKTFNQSEVPIPISVRVTDFTAEEDSGHMIFDESAQDISIATRKWIDIEKPKFILEEGEREDVMVKISVPENAEPGGHYAVILFEPTLPPQYFKEGQARVIPTLGVIFLLSVKTFALETIPQDQQIEIVEFGVPQEQRMENLEKALASVLQIVPTALAADISIVERTPSSFVLRIKNNDIFHHKLSGKLLVLNALGQKVGEMEIQRTTVLPRKTRRFPIDFSPEPTHRFKWMPAQISNLLSENMPGSYQAILGLSEEKSGLVVNRTIGFWTFPWKMISLILLIFALLILGRRRIKVAIKALIGYRE